METRPITISVSPEAAKFYNAASKQEKQKLNALLSLRLSEFAQPSGSLEEIIQKASVEAQKNGLTEEMLQELLNEE